MHPLLSLAVAHVETGIRADVACLSPAWVRTCVLARKPTHLHSLSRDLAMAESAGKCCAHLHRPARFP